MKLSNLIAVYEDRVDYLTGSEYDEDLVELSVLIDVIGDLKEVDG